MKKVLRAALTAFLLIPVLCAPVRADLMGDVFPSGMGGDPFAPGNETPQVSTSIAATASSYSDKPFVVVATYKLPGQWHAYYENPGTFGLPMTAEMPAVEGFRIEGPFFSVPERLESPLGVSYGYGTVKVAFRVTPLADAPASASFSVKSAIQMCRDGECLPPEDVETGMELAKGDGAAAADASSLADGVVGLDPAADRRGLGSIRAGLHGEEIKLYLDAPQGSLKEGSVYFFSADNSVFPPAAQTLAYENDGYVLSMTRNMNADSMYPVKDVDDGVTPPAPSALKGVLVMDGRGLLVDEPFETKPAAVVDAATGGTVSAGSYDGLLVIACLMFVGGLILNLMPCVFPVIGLKILSFVELGGGERKKVLSHSMTFVTGVLVSFWALTLLLVILKASLEGSGKVVNWAMWMELPWVIFCLLLLILVLALSMYGIFEIGVRATGAGAGLQGKKGRAGSFWSGVLATVIATPCSAPILGSAMPSALAFPALGMFVVFTAMGLGMASPYLVLGAFPGLLKYLPKPGAWMESFKQGLSFLLFATAAWLVWVYLSSFADPQAQLWMMVGLVVFSAAWWVYGRWCPMYRSRKTRVYGLLAALVLAGLGFWMSAPSSPQAETKQGIVWQEWSPEAQKKALDEGKPVYVDFTAKWCLTCQANKKIAYTDSVAQLVGKYDIVMFKADKTTTNPQIDAALRDLGRTSVPVNVLFVPGDVTPHITIEILTPQYLEGFFNEKLSSR